MRYLRRASQTNKSSVMKFCGFEDEYLVLELELLYNIYYFLPYHLPSVLAHRMIERNEVAP